MERTITIASTFTADLLTDSVRFWLDRMEMPAVVRFAPPLQLVQTLLDPGSLFAKNASGLNVSLLRWEDLDSRRGKQSDRPLNEMVEAVQACIARAKVPHLVISGPASGRVATSARHRLYSQWDRRLLEEFDSSPQVWVIPSVELEDLYPATFSSDRRGEEIAQIPYTPAMYAAMGTAICRKLHMLTAPPYKVIVLDCDDTLWEGACGEDGPHGVKIDPLHAALQEFFVAQSRQGALICLCSKNNEEDVEAVFQKNPGMRLRKEHVAIARIGWTPKAETLLSIADELGVGTDSLVFIDDDPVECEAVRAALPDVLTLQLPLRPRDYAAFLGRVWAFDRPKATQEDTRRRQLYKEAREREQLRRNSATLEEFISGLKLKVRFTPVSEAILPRASQLTFRVNQFNFTTIRRTEAELAALLRGGAMKGLAVDVSDRFGRYGLVGLVLFAATPDALQVDTLLLSCRALGRGVEHRILTELARIAKSMGLGEIRLRLDPTPKNWPARDFVERELGSYRRGDRAECWVPTNVAAAIRYRPEKAPSAPLEQEIPAGKSARGEQKPHVSRAAQLAWIAAEMRDADKIAASIEDWKRRQRAASHASFIPPRTDLERKLSEIWAEVLGLRKVGVQDNFFELGGDSLAMVRVNIRIYQTTGSEFPLEAFFEEPTIEAHAAKIARYGLEKVSL